ncbi:MAG: HAD-IIIC family phosphatase [Muribaculaceae bacterium]|nr:HAD-IIIC family phosphatase [Muribaculaceae bacterium]
MYIFRNYTIENLFDESCEFSGYDDISQIPEADSYLWFYTVPIGAVHEHTVTEINGIADKLKLVADAVPASAPFYILTLENLFNAAVCYSDRNVDEAISAVNELVWRIASEKPNVRVIDFGEFLSRHNPDTWMNWKFYFLSQMIISPALAPAFREWWGKKLQELNQPRKKCLVLDLDNTLWSGVLGEDGVSGVKMSGDYPGNAFMYFQEALVSLVNSGVILTVCSKNNEVDVKELWAKNPFVKLGPKHIAAYRINWQNKADNIRELAKELNIGLDSMVFVDDNPTERELVRQQLPMVVVPEFPRRPYELMDFYKKLVNDYFRTYRLTNEDLSKTEQYKANARRASEQARFTDLTDFIRSLDIHIDIVGANEFNIPRIVQMTQKTNQFNLTTHRYTEADINSLIVKGYDIYCISVSDKFGDNGITGEILISNRGEIAIIDTLLLSCRILGKNIEAAFVKSILNILYNKGIRLVKAKYIPTAKNSQVADFYDKLGFDVINEEDGAKEYELKLESLQEIPDYYTINIT